MSSEKTIRTKSGSAPGLSKPGRIVHARRSEPEVASDNCARASFRENQGARGVTAGMPWRGVGGGERGRSFGIHGVGPLVSALTLTLTLKSRR